MNRNKNKIKFLAVILSVTVIAGGMPVSAADATVTGQTVTIVGDISEENGIYTGNATGVNGHVTVTEAGAPTNLEDSAHNTLNLDATTGTISATNVFAGGVGYMVNAINNTANVSGGNFTNSNCSVAGGYSYGADAEYNIINLTSFTGTIGVAEGGVAVAGSANCNTVKMSGGTVETLQGGGSHSGSASYNTIEVTGGTINKAIYGGEIDDSYYSQYNTVTLSGNVTLGSSANVYGGRSNGYGINCFTGNTLNLEKTGFSIYELANFQYVNITLPASFDTTNPVLTASIIGLTDSSASTCSTIDINVESGSFLKVGDKVTLFKAGKTLSADGLDGALVSDEDSGYEFTLSADSEQVIAEVTKQPYQATINKGSGSGIYSEGDTVTITADQAPSGQIFSGWTSSDGVTFASANNATTTFVMPQKAVTVTANYKDIGVTGLTLNRSSASLKVGKTVSLSAKITSSGTSDSSITWSSSNTSVATVNKNGVVSAVGVGSATIIAASNSNSSVSAACKVTVSIGQVANLTATKNNTSSIKLSWDKQNNVSGYEIYRYDSAKKKYVKINTIKKDSTKTYTDSKLSVAETYNYKVRAYVTISGKTTYGSDSSILTTATVSKKPTIAVKAGSKKATLTWNKVTSISGYEIYMSKSKSSGYTMIKALSSKNTTYAKTKLTKGSAYYFKIRTYKTVAGVKIYSSYSTVKKVTVK